MDLTPQNVDTHFSKLSINMSDETNSQAVDLANTSGVTPESLKRTLTEKLNAEHVGIEDISGICPTTSQCNTC